MPSEDRELSEAELLEVIGQTRADLAACSDSLREIKGMLGIPSPRPDLTLVKESD